MDKIISKTQASSIVKIVNHLMEVHDITTQMAVDLLRLYSGYSNVNSMSVVALNNKGIINDNFEINPGILWKGFDIKQGELDLEFSSIKPSNSDIDCSQFIEKIEDTLIPKNAVSIFDGKEYPIYEARTRKYAAEYFKSDMVQAKYFALLSFIFPPSRNANTETYKTWCKHFKISYNGTTRWHPTVGIANSFTKTIYNVKNVELFIIGAYLAVKDSIDIEGNNCFIVSFGKFIQQHSEWYQTALDKITKATKKANKKADSEEKNSDNYKIDTL
jgi:fructose-specific phosphotransferase system component IIB